MRHDDMRGKFQIRPSEGLDYIIFSAIMVPAPIVT